MCGGGGNIKKRGKPVGGGNSDERRDAVGGNKRRIQVVIKLEQRQEKDYLKVETEDRKVTHVG